MSKILITIVFVILVIFIALFIIGENAPTDVERAEINEENTDNEKKDENTTALVPFAEGELETRLSALNGDSLDFKYTGFGPGKSHTGTFDKIVISDVSHDGQLVTGGKVVFGASSVNVEPEMLKKHLCTPDFFDCQKYPDISFELTKLERVSDTELRATGDLLFKGITKIVSFTVKVDGDVYSSDFVLDMTPFGFKDGLADPEVQIQFSTKI